MYTGQAFMKADQQPYVSYSENVLTFNDIQTAVSYSYDVLRSTATLLLLSE